jgi:hypothetical protein
MRIASKSLWDPNFDNWASYTFTNSNIHCTGIVFGDYFEWMILNKPSNFINLQTLVISKLILYIFSGCQLA